MIRASLRQWNDPILRERALEVEITDLPALRRLLSDMKYAMNRGAIDPCGGAKINGCGLAAPQIGVPLRVIILLPAIGRPLITLINPVITEQSEKLITADEGCLSYSGVCAPVERRESITISHLDFNATAQQMVTDQANRSIRLMGAGARIAQHEINHLDGVCKVGDSWRKALSKIAQPVPPSLAPTAPRAAHPNLSPRQRTITVGVHR